MKEWMTETMIQTLPILAQSSGSKSGQPEATIFDMLFPLILMFIIFYFLLIRPQQKKQREHQELVSSVKTGDKVVAAGGIYGVITNVKDRSVMLKVSDNVKLEVEKSSISTVTRADEDKKSDSEKDKK